ncbi:MAG: hypothetical protein JWN46_2741 [Acidimicrobiales bacterium]|nr:hypothetical protein [Acidimicrobiales bacterium]
MNTLDLLIVAASVTAAVGGYRLGFVTRVTSWIGMALGVVAGAFLMPPLISSLNASSNRGTLLLVAAAVMIAFAFAGQAVGLFIGSRLHLALPHGILRKVDAVVGGAAGVLGVLVAVWLLAPAMADVPDWPARQARTSTVVRAIDRAFPNPPNTARALRRLVGERYPQVFEGLRPAPRLGPPPPATGLTTALADQVASSTVKVVGEACSRIQEGSGFVVSPDLVATNAHVVAGERSTQVERSDGQRLDGQVVAFDPDLDLALVRVPGLGRPALPLRPAVIGDRGGVFGHPGGGPLRITPFQVGDKVTATGSDIYDSRRTQRQVLFLAAQLQPGDSGSALVDPSGRVIGVAFAIAPDRPAVAYALTVDELRSVLARDRSQPVLAGSCIA